MTQPDRPDPRRTPLYDCHQEAGAKLVAFAGWEMPVRYRGEIAEHRTVRTAAGLFDVSHMGEIRLRGAGALELLQRLTPNDVTKLRPGRAHYSGLLTEQATYIDDLLVYQLAADDYLLVVNASNTDEDLRWILSQPRSDCEIEEVTADYALLALQGPKAGEILARHTDADFAALRYYRFVEGRIGGVEGLISRTGYTGEDGFELFLPPDEAPGLWRELLASGAGDGLTPAGLAARDTLRLEAGMALYGHEIDATTTPYEAGLDWVVKLKKGDFIGRDVLAAQREEGVARRLVGFEVRGRGIARQGGAVFHEDREVGAVTSGTWSPTFEKAIGTAYVPAELAAEGTRLEIAVRKRRLEAVVVKLPFYRRS